ncbi:carbohydrate sulfotransferase 11-like [Branchiostoma lanceolatum]|uniref:carbohydrate sulfotransferase 11-like n=1 Tax=Branchiostoma lanceolatum TaxID=7740 RepID=UPI0034560936
MTLRRPTARFLFLSFLILSTVATYMGISYIGHELSSQERVIGASAGNQVEKENGESLAEAEKEQSRRRATFKAYCEKNNSMVDPSQARLGSHLFVFENIKTIYCYVPKCACKTMKLLLYNLENNKTARLMGVNRAQFLANISNYSANDHHSGWIHGQHFKRLTQYSKEEASKLLATYKKIIVVRDPLERLASAWLNKFVNMPAHVGNFGWVKGLNNRLRSYQDLNPTDKVSELKEERALDAKQPVPFRKFLFAVSKHLMENEHWLSFNRLCLPCQVDYDFIAHTDTLASDVRLFLKKNNMTANEDILPKQLPRNANEDNVFSDIYSQVPTEEIISLRETFQEDFNMFGYSFEQDLAKILTGKAMG